jgi:transposase
VLDSGRAVEDVAASYGAAWRTVQDAVDAAVVELPEVDTLRVRHLGVDEHGFARARFFRDDTGGWQRVEPWMSTFVSIDTGQVLGIVDGRNSTGLQGWLDAAPRPGGTGSRSSRSTPPRRSGAPSRPLSPRRGSASTTGTWCGSRT